ncbi:hypothetical protein ACFX2I_030905 [Malus domestica]
MAIQVHLVGLIEAFSTVSRYPGASGCRRHGPSVQTPSARRRSSKPEAGNRTRNLCHSRNPRVLNPGFRVEVRRRRLRPRISSNAWVFSVLPKKKKWCPFSSCEWVCWVQCFRCRRHWREALGGFRLCDLGGLSSKNCGLKAFNFKDFKATPFEMTLLGLMTV